MPHRKSLESRRRTLVETPLFNLKFMPSLLLLPDSLHIYRATDAAAQTLGYTHEQLRQMTLYDLLVEDRSTVDDTLTRARTAPPFVLTVRRPDREERIIEGIVHLLPEYELLYLSFADLTGLHMVVRLSNRLATASPSATGVAFMNEMTRLISQAWGGVHVYVGRLVNNTALQGVAYAVAGETREPPNYALADTPCENVVVGGVCFYPRSVQTMFLRDSDLQKIGLESYLGAPLRDPFGRTIGIFWVADTKPLPNLRPLRDMFSVLTVRVAHELMRIQAEAEAQRLREQLIQAQKMESVGRMAGGLAHDFNNLLTAMLGYVELAQSALAQDHPAYAFLNNAILAVEKASEVTRQLMALARQQPMQRRPLNLNTVVQEALQIASSWLLPNIQVQTYLSDALWLTEADHAQLMQVLQNLLLNARDAIPETGGVITIETQNVRLDEAYTRAHYEVVPGDYVMLMVSDTGVGMPPQVRERIFEPFFTTKPRGQGTGLGLSIVYSIVKQSGGHIWVYSEAGKGTTFKVYLPRAYDRAPLAPAERPIPTPPPRGNETLLVVEDEPGVLEVATETLRQYGYRVLTAQSPPEALQIAQNLGEPIHLLITDVVMPVMSGRELADYIQQRLHPNIKVLYVSGYTENTIVHHGVLEPGVNFLPKPYTPTQLAQKVREVLDRPAP
ncbi:MAG: ATP-binding protein [bacterium]|nr:ATP-binding protein [bacterium]